MVFEHPSLLKCVHLERYLISNYLTPFWEVAKLDPRIQKVLSLMESTLQQKQSVQRMAQSVNLSLWHLHRLFKAETGMTPAKYLKHLRMEKAVHLLETTFLSAKEIMTKIGVRDESHFVRDFRKAYGMTPIRYRTLFLSGSPRKGVK